MTTKPTSTRRTKEQTESPHRTPAAKESSADSSARATQTAHFAPHRLTPRDVAQLQRSVGNRAVGQLLQRKSVAPEGGASPLPDTLQQGISALSGMDMSDVRVFRGSAQPAGVGALAYAQGNDIHIAPGQDQHLAHEAWHVVQQRQGRVAPSFTTPQGVAINDDSSLEREADTMGSRALTAPPIDQPTERVALPEGPLPLQGVFKKGENEGEFIDEDTNSVYVFVKDGHNERLGIGFIVLRRKDGFTVTIRADTFEPIFEDEEDEEYRLDEEEYDVSMTYESEVNPKGEEEEPIPDDDMVTLEDLPFTWEESEKLKEPTTKKKRKNVTTKGDVEERVGRKANTDFTSQVSLVPATKGTITENVYLNGEPVYTSAQLWVEDLRIGDQDRPDTRFDTQKSHTVAWTLLRAELNAFRTLPLRTVVANILMRLGDLKKLAQALITTRSDSKLKGKQRTALWEVKAIEELSLKLGAAGQLGGDMISATARLPITLWQNSTSQLLKLCIQADQLSKGATYADGAAKGHGESHAMARLRHHNAAVADTGKLGDPLSPEKTASAEVLEAADTLLDVKFTLSMKPEAYAFAVHHWMQALFMAFPALMKTFSVDITAPILKAETKGEARKTGAKTVEELVKLFEFGGLKETGEQAQTALSQPRVINSDVGKLRIDVPATLNTDFTANAEVVPLSIGKLTRDVPPQPPQSPSVKPEANREKSTFRDDKGESERNVQMPFYTADQLQMRRLHISDLDRPDTRYGTAQMSHTVAWTLVRAQIRSHGGGTVQSLLKFAYDDLNTLKAHVANHAGAELLQKTVNQLAEVLTSSLPSNAWQVLASDVVRRYMVIYQVSHSATYSDTTTLGRALGHGEASHMEVLRENEASLTNSGKWVHPHTRIIEAATKLMDIQPDSSLSQKAAYAAYHHWLSALKSSFPKIMSVGEKAIKDTVLDQLLPSALIEKYKVKTLRQWLAAEMK